MTELHRKFKKKLAVKSQIGAILDVKGEKRHRKATEVKWEQGPGSGPGCIPAEPKQFYRYFKASRLLSFHVLSRYVRLIFMSLTGGLTAATMIRSHSFVLGMRAFHISRTCACASLSGTSDHTKIMDTLMDWFPLIVRKMTVLTAPSEEKLADERERL